MAGDDGLARILSESFDLVLLDLMLPGRTGFEVLEAVRSRAPVPIIVLSALTDLPSRLQSFEAGAVDYVAKPFFIEELVARIRTRLGHGATRRASYHWATRSSTSMRESPDATAWTSASRVTSST